MTVKEATINFFKEKGYEYTESYVPSKIPEVSCLACYTEDAILAPLTEYLKGIADLQMEGGEFEGAMAESTEKGTVHFFPAM